MNPTGLVEHFFRHESGRLVSSLARRFGVHQLDAIEDAVQDALMRALETWGPGGLPDNPAAWLTRVATHRLTDRLRQTRHRAELLARRAEAPVEAPPEPLEPALEGELSDDLLRMLFVCCDDTLPTHTQLVLALKLLCGFSVPEIARRLFVSEAHVYKRLSRGRSRLRSQRPDRLDLPVTRYADRVSAVHQVLYLLFTEGHLSTGASAPIRQEICEEAIRLTEALIRHPVGQTPETYALLALMCLHRARLPARIGPDGGVMLLQAQDRSRVDQAWLARGLHWLSASADGERFSRYHAEAGIVAEHCLAPTFEATRWPVIARSYEMLEQIAPSALHRLNRALAVAEWRGPEAGLAVLDEATLPAWLEGACFLEAVRADLHRRCGHEAEARLHGGRALMQAPTEAVRALLAQRLGLAVESEAGSH